MGIRKYMLLTFIWVLRESKIQTSESKEIITQEFIFCPDMHRQPPLKSLKEATFQADSKNIGRKIRNTVSVPPLNYGQNSP